MALPMSIKVNNYQGMDMKEVLGAYRKWFNDKGRPFLLFWKLILKINLQYSKIYIHVKSLKRKEATGLDQPVKYKGDIVSPFYLSVSFIENF